MANPGSVVGDDSYDAGAREEARVNRAVSGSNTRALGGGVQGSRPVKSKPTSWTFIVRGFPANGQHRLTFLVDGSELINSGDSRVDVTVQAPIQGTKATVSISIPALNNFANTRDFFPQEGVFVKYEFTDKGLALGQQTTPF